MIKEITSKENNKIKHATSLKLAKYRHEYHEFLAEGIKSLELALKAGVVKEIFTLKPIKGIKEDIVQYIVNESLLKKLAFSQNPEGIVFTCLMKDKNIKSFNHAIYLDHISDPGNMGTIIRTALAFNYDCVYVSDGCCDIYNEKVIAASKGSIFLLPIIKEDLSLLKSKAKIIVSTLDNDSIEISQIEVKKPLVIVLGNEAHGVSEEVLKLADQKVRIDIQNIDSLNVSIAAGILMHAFKNK